MAITKQVRTDGLTKSIKDTQVKRFAESSAKLDSAVLGLAQTALQGTLAHSTLPSPRRELVTKESNDIQLVLDDLDHALAGETYLTSAYLSESEVVTYYHTASRTVRAWTGMVPPSYIPDFSKVWFPSQIAKIDGLANQTWHLFTDAKDVLEQEAIVIFKRKWMAVEELTRLGHEKLSTPRNVKEWKNISDAPNIPSAPPPIVAQSIWTEDRLNEWPIILFMGLLAGVIGALSRPLADNALWILQDYCRMPFHSYLILSFVTSVGIQMSMCLIAWLLLRQLARAWLSRLGISRVSSTKA